MLHSASSLEVTVCITIAASVVIIYTCTGGLLADVMTDLIQGIAIIVGLLAILFVLAVNPAIHFGEAWRALDASKFQFFGDPQASKWAMLELWMLTLCGSLVAQEVAARVLAARSPAVARNSALMGGGLYLAIGLIPAFLGLIGTHLLPNLANPEHILPRIAEKYLPPFLYILFMGAIVSAILSTVDSTLLAAAALISHNCIVSLKPGMSDARKLLLARSGVVVFGIVAYALALGARSIFELVQQANGVGSSGVFIVMLFGLFTKLGRARAGFSTLTVGLGLWAYGTYVGEWTCTYLISLTGSLITYVVVGWFERPKSRDPVSAAPLAMDAG